VVIHQITFGRHSILLRFELAGFLPSRLQKKRHLIDWLLVDCCVKKLTICLIIRVPCADVGGAQRSGGWAGRDFCSPRASLGVALEGESLSLFVPIRAHSAPMLERVANGTGEGNGVGVGAFLPVFPCVPGNKNLLRFGSSRFRLLRAGSLLFLGLSLLTYPGVDEEDGGVVANVRRVQQGADALVGFHPRDNDHVGIFDHP